VVLVIVRSVAEDDCREFSSEDTAAAVAEESQLTTSTSSQGSSDAVSVADSDANILSSGNHPSTSSTSDDEPPTESEKCKLQGVGISSTKTNEAELVRVSRKSGDSGPCGLVAFCQSGESAFSSVVPVKQVTSPVIVPDCDQRLRDSNSSASGRSVSAGGPFYASHNTSVCDVDYSVPDYGEPALGCCYQLSRYNGDSARPYCGSDEPAQSFTESPVSEYDVASSYGQHSSSVSAADESFLEDQSAVCDECVYTHSGFDPQVAHCPSCVPVPVASLPPCSPCYPAPVRGITYPPYASPVPTYVPPMAPYYSSRISVVHPYAYSTYPMMPPPPPPPGMMPPAGMVPMAYPPFPSPAPYWGPPSVMCRPAPWQPSYPW